MACLLAIQLKNIEFVIDQQNESVKVRLVHTAMWRTGGVTIAVCVALVVKLVDTRDLKSLDFRVVPVQVRPGAPSNFQIWRVSRVVMHRIANPCTSVRFRYAPPFLSCFVSKLFHYLNLKFSVLSLFSNFLFSSCLYCIAALCHTNRNA